MRNTRFGVHRVLDTKASTCQAAERLNNDPALLSDDELLVEVRVLNLDSTSAVQLSKTPQGLQRSVLEIVAQRGKMHNAVTNSGGVLVGKVLQCGARRRQQVAVGATVVPLCSLTALPLKVFHISAVDEHAHRVWVQGVAVVYDSVIVAEISPEEEREFSLEGLLAAIDVSRLVPQLVRVAAQLRTTPPRPITRDDPFVVACIGCGRSGFVALALCAELFPDAVLVALDLSQQNLQLVSSLAIPGCHVEKCDATQPLQVLECVGRHSGGRGADLVLNLVNVGNTEAGTSLCARTGATVVYFSMATNFARATLSTDVTGNPMNVLIGAGVFSDQASSTIGLLRRHPRLGALFKSKHDDPPSSGKNLRPATSATVAKPVSVISSDVPFYPASTSSAMHEFSRFVGKSGASYAELHRWSVEHLEDFWRGCFDFFGVKSTAPVQHVMKRRGPLLSDVDFFVGAEVNLAETLLRHARGHGQKTAIAAFGEAPASRTSITYDELYARVGALQKTLRRLGVKKGTVVAALLPNVIEAAVIMLAVTACGGVWCALGPDLGKDIILARLGQVNAQLLFVAQSYSYGGKIFDRTQAFRDVARALPTVRHTICVSPRANASFPVEWLRLDALIAEGQGHEPDFSTRVSFSDPMYIMFTSGTTGLPKCVVQSFGVSLNQLKEHVLHFDISHKDVVLCYSSLSWMMWCYSMNVLATGATLCIFDGAPVLGQKFPLWDIVAIMKVTVWLNSSRYLDATRKASFDPTLAAGKWLRLITSTGSVLPPEAAEYFHKILPHVVVASGSGGTEINGSLCLSNPMSPVFGGGELPGPPLGMDVDVVSGSTLQRVVGAEGELALFSAAPCLPLYFLNDKNHERYRASYFSRDPGIWLHGDWALRTPHGGFLILGRSDATLNPGGVRIGTRDYYSVVEQIEGVRILDSVVVGIPNADRSDEEVALFVVLPAGETLTDASISKIRSTIRDKLSPKHVPKHIAQVSAIPINLNMKKMEILVRDLVSGKVRSSATPLSNPSSVDDFVAWADKNRKAKTTSKL